MAQQKSEQLLLSLDNKVIKKLGLLSGSIKRINDSLKSKPQEQEVELVNSFFGMINKTNKEISQLIAQAWIDNKTIDKEEIISLLVKNYLISKGDTKYVNVVIDTKPYDKDKWQSAGGSTENIPKNTPDKGENYAGFWTFFEKPTQPGEFKLQTNLYVPFPDRPPEVTNGTLETWVNQSSSQAPFYPDPKLGLPKDAVWIPYSC